MRSGFAWAALVSLGFALLAGLIHYGYHLYVWVVSGTLHETFDTVMVFISALFVIIGFLLLGAGLLLAEPKVQNFIQSRPVSNSVVPSKLYNPHPRATIFDYAELR